MKFNGYSVRTLGSFISLDSFYVNLDNEKKFRVKVKFTVNLFFRDSFPRIQLDDNKWTMTLGGGLMDDAIIEILTPVGINSDQVTWSGPCDGFLIIESP